MWWNNVETKPGTGYPSKWENQDAYKGGWEKNGDSLELKGAGKLKGLKPSFTIHICQPWIIITNHGITSTVNCSIRPRWTTSQLQRPFR